MTSVRKKKKLKGDPKSSEQLRNWLAKQTKSKKSNPPVTFNEFSKIVENLPDIAFQIQCNEPNAFNKTLDECALWYYEAFYSDPSIRTKYEFTVKPGPLRIKEKLLQEASTSSKTATTKQSSANDNQIESENELVPTEDGCEVIVHKSGRFLFPVSFATFERYVDRKALINILVSKETKGNAEREKMLTDEPRCRKILKKYYNSFYMYPSKRILEKCKFNKAPPALREQLLKLGVPLDKLAFQTMKKKSEKRKSVESAMESSVQQPNHGGISSIVSYEVFEKHIRNLYNVVWNLKLNEPEYSYKGFEDCAHEYYLDFYLSPGIRDKYPYDLVPCTTSMQNRLLALPSHEDRQTLLQMRRQNKPASPDVQAKQLEIQSDLAELAELAAQCNECLTPCQEETTEKENTLPVSFSMFKRYIRNLSEIVQEMQSSQEYQGKTEEECAFEYYRRFYTDPQIRQRFACVIKPCPGRIRAKLLTLPDEVEDIEILSNSCDDPCNEPNVPSVKSADVPMPVRISGVNYRFQVSYETFTRYINYDEVLAQLVEPFAKKNCEKPTDQDLMERYYYLFYTDERVRKQTKCNFDAAPEELREKLLEMAVPVSDEDSQSHDELEICETPEMTPSVNERQVIEVAEEIIPDIEVTEETIPDPKSQSRSSVNECQIVEVTEEIIPDIEVTEETIPDPSSQSRSSVNECQIVEVTEEIIPDIEVTEETIPDTNSQSSNVDLEVNMDLPDCKLDVVENLGRAGRFLFPVSFETFMRCINYQELLRPLLMRVMPDESQVDALSTNPDDPQCQKIFQRYYHSFYVKPNTRELYKYRFVNVTLELSKKLLEYAKPLDEQAKKEVAAVEKELALAREKKEKEQMDEFVQSFPVSFKQFKRSIQNLDAIVKLMQSDEKFKNKSADECAWDYFIAFYMDPKVREQFVFQLKPCPAKLRAKLLQLPAENLASNISVQENPSEESTKPAPEAAQQNLVPVAGSVAPLDINSSSEQSNKNKIIVQSERILITLKGITYEFPVSLQTFKRYLNYDVIRVELVNAYAKDKRKVKEILSKEDNNLVLLRNFYHSFYTKVAIRRMFNYNFNAAPPEMREKLLKAAVVCKQHPLQRAAEREDKRDEPRAEQQGEAESSVEPTAEQQAEQEEMEVLDVEEESPADVEPPAEQQLEEEEVVVEEESPAHVECEADQREEQESLSSFESGLEQESTPQAQQQAVDDSKMQYPISFSIFSKLLNLDEVVQKMQQEAQFASATSNECKLAYYYAFYRNPEIRTKYKCTIKPCPALLRAQLLEIPTPNPKLVPAIVSNETVQSTAALHAARRAELEKMEKSNLKKYLPSNLVSYISLRTNCPKKREILEKHFVGSSTFKQKESTATAGSITRSGISEKTTAEQKSDNGQDSVGKQALESEENKAAERNKTKATKAVEKTMPSSQIDGVPAGRPATRDTAQQVCEDPLPANPQPTARAKNVAQEAPKESSAEVAVPPTKPAQDLAQEAAVAAAVPPTKPAKDVEKKATKAPPAGSAAAVPPTKPAKDVTQEPAVEAAVPPRKPVENVVQKVIQATSALNEVAVPPKVTETKRMSLGEAEPATAKEVSTEISTQMLEKDTRTGTVSLKEYVASKTPKSTEARRVSGILQVDVRNNISGESEQSVDSQQALPPPSFSATVMIPAIALGAAEEFFAPIGKEHNLAYLLCTSSGFKRNVWRILSHMSYQEFKEYTSLYGGSKVYEDDNLLSLFYHYVLKRGHWPVHFYVKLKMLPQLLQRKGIHLEALDLGQLSPKMLHYSELLKLTNFDEIVERNFVAQTGNSLGDIDMLFEEAARFYTKCWQHDQWLHEVPEISNELAQQIDWNVQKEEPLPPLTLPLCMTPQPQTFEVKVVEAPNEESQDGFTAIETASEESPPSDLNAPECGTTSENSAPSDLNVSQLASQSLACPSTQLEVSLRPTAFVDMESVCAATQAMETEYDPLQDSRAIPADSSVNIKQEPIKFLNMMRFSQHSNSDGFSCDIITNEEQIINLDNDSEQRDADKLACFTIPQSNETVSPPTTGSSAGSASDSFQKLLAEIHRLDDEMDVGANMWVESVNENRVDLSQEQAVQRTSPMIAEPALRGSPVLEKAALRASQMIDQAALRASQMIEHAALMASPQIDQTALRSSPMTEQAALRGSPTIEQVSLRASMMINHAAQLATLIIDKAAMRASPQIDQAALRASPMIEQAALRAFQMIDQTTLRTSQQVEQAAPKTSPQVEQNASSPTLAIVPTSEQVPPGSNLLPITAKTKKKAPSSTVPVRKKPRLMAVNVPQLKHAFRPLPLSAMVRIEPQGFALHGNVLETELQEEQRMELQDEQSKEPERIQRPASESQPNTQESMTVSQALSTDNTLMASSQLQHLLDAANMTLRKVIVEEDVSDSSKGSRVVPPPVEISRRFVFGTLERFLYFNSLTTAQISKYHINSLAVGSPYQQAKVCVEERFCNVSGPLLECMFSHCSPSLLADMKHLLRQIGELNYNCRQAFCMDPMQDLRCRVLCTFMRVVSPFSIFRLKFENESRQWATCSVVGKEDSQKIIAKCDVSPAIRPEILERMKEVKSLLKYHF